MRTEFLRVEIKIHEVWPHRGLARGRHPDAVVVGLENAVAPGLQ